MVAVTADKVVVELEAKLGEYDAKVAASEKKFTAAMAAEEKAAAKAEAAVQKAAAAKAAAEQRAAVAAAKAAAANALAAERTAKAEAAKTSASATSSVAAQKAAALEIEAAGKAAVARAAAAEKAARAEAKKQAAADASALAAKRAAAIEQTMADRAARAVERAADREARARARAAALAEKAARQNERNAAFIASSIKGLAATAGFVSVLALARGLLTVADEAKNLEAQLKLATAQTGNFGRATEDVRRIAEVTRSGLADTASLYGNFQRNARELGITQAEAARATETVAKTFKISGATAVDAAQGVRQLVQGLQSGVLRGDEFNSIMENSPRLARLLADSLGVPIGQLRAMAEAGQLTSDKLVRAFTDRRYTDGIDAEFAQLPVTFDQAMTQVRNAAVITFGAFDRGGEFSTALASFITQGSDGFEQLEEDAFAMGANIRASIEGLESAFTPVTSAGETAANAIRLAFDVMTLGVLDDITSIENAMSGIDTVIGLLRSNPLTASTALLFGPSPNKRERYVEGRDKSLAGARYRRFDETFGGAANRQFLDAILGKTPPAPTGGGGGRTKPRKARGPSAETLAARAEAARVREERREQAYDDELARINQDILDARQALQTGAAILAQIERDKIEAERKAYEDGLASDVETGKLKADEAEQLRQANNRRAAAETDVVDARERERIADQQLAIAQNELRDAIDIEQLTGDLATTREQRKASELRLLDLQYREERQALERVRDNEKLDQKVRDDAARALGDLETKRDLQRRGIDDRYLSPLEQYRRQLQGDGLSIQDQIENIEVRSLQALEDSLVRATTKALGLKGALGDIVGELIRIGIQRQIIGPLADALFGAATGGTGGAVGGILSSLFGGGRAAGGPVSAGKFYVVGEKGPELFAPGQSGTIVPQAKAIRAVNGRASGARPQITILAPQQFDLRGVVMTPDLVRQMDARNRAYADQVGAAAVKASLRAAPARLAQFQSDGV